jgi:hypothetical protein
MQQTLRPTHHSTNLTHTHLGKGLPAPQALMWDCLAEHALLRGSSNRRPQVPLVQPPRCVRRPFQQMDCSSAYRWTSNRFAFVYLSYRNLSVAWIHQRTCGSTTDRPNKRSVPGVLVWPTLVGCSFAQTIIFPQVPKYFTKRFHFFYMFTPKYLYL